MRQARDTDSSDRLTVVALAVAFYLLLSFFESVLGYRSLWLGMLVTPVAALGLGAVVWTLIGRVGAVTESLLMPSGTPPVAEFSAEDALIVRHRFDEAMVAFQRRLTANPADVAARLRLAALLNDHLGDHDGAAQCYRAIRNLAGGAKHDWVVTNGLIDLHRIAGNRQGLKEELGRLARHFRSTAAGRHARAELARLLREDAGTGTR